MSGAKAGLLSNSDNWCKPGADCPICDGWRAQDAEILQYGMALSTAAPKSTVVEHGAQNCSTIGGQPLVDPIPWTAEVCAPFVESTESILQEAHRLTHGDRDEQYGPPLDNFEHTAAVVSALLARKLKEPITPDEMALVMVCVKLSRQIHKPKRDNMVDAAGYCWVAQECLDETERRKSVTHYPV